jgi:hypothetical protein
VGEELGVGRTQIMNILKRKREILDDFENNASSCHMPHKVDGEVTDKYERIH